MYAKVFTQIFDSSIADDYQTRHVFEDLLKLADPDGVVDMTHEAIAARTRVPIGIIRNGIRKLEGPDPRSRTPDHKGIRIKRLDDHRDWGWFIVNYHKFRAIASEEQRREKTRLRVRRHREESRNQSLAANVTQCNADVTAGNVSPSPSPSTCPSGEGGAGEGENGHPTWEMIEGWLAQAQKDGADYTRFEARSAFLAFNTNGWMWGVNPVVDWRSGIERQIQSDRNRNQKPNKPKRYVPNI